LGQTCGKATGQLQYPEFVDVLIRVALAIPFPTELGTHLVSTIFPSAAAPFFSSSDTTHSPVLVLILFFFPRLHSTPGPLAFAAEVVASSGKHTWP
jgi:hypothetical protein